MDDGWLPWLLPIGDLYRDAPARRYDFGVVTVIPTEPEQLRMRRWSGKWPDCLSYRTLGGPTVPQPGHGLGDKALSLGEMAALPDFNARPMPMNKSKRIGSWKS